MTTTRDNSPHRSAEQEHKLRIMAARTAVKASKRTGNILPRKIYVLAGEPVPPTATNTMQYTK